MVLPILGALLAISICLWSGLGFSPSVCLPLSIVYRGVGTGETPVELPETVLPGPKGFNYLPLYNCSHVLGGGEVVICGGIREKNFGAFHGSRPGPRV